MKFLKCILCILGFHKWPKVPFDVGTKRECKWCDLKQTLVDSELKDNVGYRSLPCLVWIDNDSNNYSLKITVLAWVAIVLLGINLWIFFVCI